MTFQKRLRNVGVRLIDVCGISASYRTRIHASRPLVRVIVFHDVLDRGWFESMVVALTHAYHVITPDEFLAGTFNPEKINVLLTFDDGYQSWVDVVLPVLQKHEVTGIFFINSGLIDAYADQEKQTTYVEKRLLLSPRRTLSWDGARTLARMGHRIGGHTTTHARLSAVSEETQQIEIVDDKKRIEEILGVPVIFFAYPFGQSGDYTETTMRFTRECGYTYAFTTEAGFADVKHAHRIPRLCIEDGLSPKVLRSWIEGGYDIFYSIKKICVR
jgi:peptidoglycan/xylan/chitin deacetylase (PgdA/CDA1 family)